MEQLTNTFTLTPLLVGLTPSVLDMARTKRKLGQLTMTEKQPDTKRARQNRKK
jgi:hypothetical protein